MKCVVLIVCVVFLPGSARSAELPAGELSDGGKNIVRAKRLMGIVKEYEPSDNVVVLNGLEDRKPQRIKLNATTHFKDKNGKSTEPFKWRRDAQVTVIATNDGAVWQALEVRQGIQEVVLPPPATNRPHGDLLNRIK